MQAAAGPVSAPAVLAAPAPKPAPAAAAAPRAPIRSFDLPTTERLGREIARQDHAAWVATDALVASLHDPAASGVVGWVVAPADPRGGPDLVRFLKGDIAAPQAGWDVRVPAAGAPVVTEAADPALTVDERAMWAARHTALAHMGPVCRPGYNTAVARDPGGRDWLVWLLAPQPTLGSVPVGGHYRFTISPDGETMKARDVLFASCLTIDPGKGLPAGAKPVVIVATHVVSPTPVETHVFLQLQAGTPMMVIAGGRQWMIDGGRIAPGQALPPAAAAR